MNRPLAPWRAATAPTTTELRSLQEPLPAEWVARLSAAMAPQAPEVARLQARWSQALAPAPPLAWRRPVLALAAILFMMGAFWAGASRSPLPPTAGTTVALGARPLRLGAGVTASGMGRLQLQSMDPAPLRVALLGGSGVFQVLPVDDTLQLTVLAGAVEFGARDAAFSAFYQPPVVGIVVERGVVEVRQGEEHLAVVAGEGWANSAAEAHGDGMSPPSVGVAAPQGDLEAGPTSLEPAVAAPPPPPSQGSGQTTLTGPALPLGAESGAPASPQPSRPEPAPGSAGATDAAVPSEPAVPSDPAVAAQAYADLLDLQELGAAAAIRRNAAERFLQDHPDSPLAAEVQVLYLEAAAQSVPSRDVLAQMDDWLARHAASPWRLRMHRARAALAHGALSDCEAALPSYQVVTVEGNAAWQAWAADGIRICGLITGPP